MADTNVFDILVRRRNRGFYPLNENHWSNVLAWVLAKQGSLSASLLQLLAPHWCHATWSVDREVEYVVDLRRRRIDIQVTADNLQRAFVEVKIDPDYQDREQIADQLALLKDGEWFTLVAPLDLSALVSEVGAGRTCVVANALTWRSVSEWCDEQIKAATSFDPLTHVILHGVSEYWDTAVTSPFEQMVQVILGEQGWTTFYPDDFKEAFLLRFPDVWFAWLADKPSTGLGNPHQYLTTCLSALANRKTGFRLFRTGRSRAPKQSDWGFPTIYELSVTAPNECTANIDVSPGHSQHKEPRP